jgi:hypothetical protein
MAPSYSRRSTYSLGSSALPTLCSSRAKSYGTKPCQPAAQARLDSCLACAAGW